MQIEEYQREKARAYAQKWAYGRNPNYYNFDSVGGDCTSFVSQCLFEANTIMNYHTNGWYYRSGNDKSPSWSGVEFLHQFLTKNTSVGPFGKEIEIEQVNVGNIAQLSFEGQKFSHSLLLVEKTGETLEDLYVATHTFDSYGRKISSYTFLNIRFIRNTRGKKMVGKFTQKHL